MTLRWLERILRWIDTRKSSQIPFRHTVKQASQGQPCKVTSLGRGQCGWFSNVCGKANLRSHVSRNPTDLGRLAYVTATPDPPSSHAWRWGLPGGLDKGLGQPLTSETAKLSASQTVCVPEWAPCHEGQTLAFVRSTL